MIVLNNRFGRFTANANIAFIVNGRLENGAAPGSGYNNRQASLYTVTVPFYTFRLYKNSSNESILYRYIGYSSAQPCITIFTYKHHILLLRCTTV